MSGGGPKGVYARFAKRLIDILGSLFCIVIFSPVMLAYAAAVKLSSPVLPLVMSTVFVCVGTLSPVQPVNS